MGLPFAFWKSSATAITYLLDTYGGASAAYSLRKLSASTSNVVRVRRSSDNAEQDFTATEITNGTLTTFTGAGDGFVTIWYDQSANSFDAAQTSATNQPQIINSGSLILQNGKPSVYTSGSKNLNTGLVSIGTNGDISLDFFAVLQNTSSGKQEHLLGLSNNGFNTNRSRVFAFANDTSSTKSVRLYGGNIVYSNSATGQLLFNTNYQGGGGAFDSRINASSLSVNSVNNSGLNIHPSSGFMLFNGNSGSPQLTNINPDSKGYVQEAIFYLNDQSANRTGIENNINAEYTIY
tara:strand:- start:1218 stop:2093 length:876 start_codon:yes stop_codon:yes gene_type:complete